MSLNWFEGGRNIGIEVFNKAVSDSIIWYALCSLAA